MAIKGKTKKFEDLINSDRSAFSLEEIILAQVDEPSQKTCIYQMAMPIRASESKSSGDYSSKNDKFIQIRVKSIDFHEIDAIAIYFYDVTHHVESQRLMQEKQE